MCVSASLFVCVCTLCGECVYMCVSASLFVLRECLYDEKRDEFRSPI